MEKRGGGVRSTRQVQVEQRFELRVHVCPSLYSCPSRVHSIRRNREEMDEEIMMFDCLCNVIFLLFKNLMVLSKEHVQE